MTKARTLLASMCVARIDATRFDHKPSHTRTPHVWAPHPLDRPNHHSAHLIAAFTLPNRPPPPRTILPSCSCALFHRPFFLIISPFFFLYSQGFNMSSKALVDFFLPRLVAANATAVMYSTWGRHDGDPPNAACCGYGTFLSMNHLTTAGYVPSVPPRARPLTAHVPLCVLAYACS